MSATNFTIRRPTPVSNDSSDVESGPTFKVPALPQRLRDASSTVRANSPLKRKLNFGDSDEEDDDAATEELVVGFDAMGAQRADGRAVKKEQLVIPAIPNKDWRAAARKRKGFRPDDDRATIGPDGSQGGLGTRDAINAGPQQAGLVVTKKRKIEESAHDSDGDSKMQVNGEDKDNTQEPMEEELTDEQRAVRALLHAAKQANDGSTIDEMPVQAIVMNDSADWRQQKSEAEAYKEDVATRPDSATLEDYHRVPVSQFGTALLLGMGWKPGQGASKSGKGPSEAYVPKARPALLGLGAKPQEVLDTGAKKTGPKPSKKYIPVIAKERERSGKDSDSSRSEFRQYERGGSSRDGKSSRYSEDADDRRRESRDRRDRSRDRSDHHRDRSRDRSRRDDRRDRDRDDEKRRSEKKEERGRDEEHDDKYRERERRNRDESSSRRR